MSEETLMSNDSELIQETSSQVEAAPPVEAPPAPPPPRKKLPLFSGEPFERMIGVLIALVTLLAALIALLEADTGAQVAQATRRAQQYAIQAIGVKGSGEVQAGYAWAEAYRRWLEWDTLAFLAEQEADPAAVRRYQAVRERAEALSPLLAEPYFNPESKDSPNIRAFEANTYLVETTILAERFINTMDLAGALDEKEQAYGTQLLLLAVSLFLFGLSATIVGRMRWLFMGMGSLIANVVIIWMSLVYIAPIQVLPDEAIVAYAQGVGLAHQSDYVGAVAAFDEALALAPDYANVLYARANAYFDQGHYQQAALDYEAAGAAGREDVNTPWNLGWTYYVLGELDESIETTGTALALDESQVALHFNLGLAHLAKGDLETAREVYEGGITQAIEQVTIAVETGEDPPASLWWYLGTAAADLDRFLICLSSKVCEEAPPYQAIAVSDDLTATAKAIRGQLKELSVALELTGEPPADPDVTATISELDFATPVYDEQNELVGFKSLGADTQLRFGRVQEEEGQEVDLNITRAGPEDAARQIFILFNYAQMAEDQLFTVKVYYEGQESTGLRLVEDWKLGESGEATLPLTPGTQFTLAPGEYRVEVYVDAHLIQEGQFTIQQS